MPRTIKISFTALPVNYKGIRAAAMIKQLDAHTHDFCEDVIKEVRPYPPARHRERLFYEYVRTDALYNAWQIVNKSGAGRIAYEIQNLVKDNRGRYYARLVHGGPDGSGQWWYHAQAGWKRIDEAMWKFGGRGVFREIAQDIISDFAL